ncbi:MAG: T9SS type A sorting domain-containing protein, partial [Chitinophagales bacterium]
PMFSQEYSNSLRKFSILDDGETVSIGDVEYIIDAENFHRRDLNFEPVMFAGAVPGLAAYSGVFQFDMNVPWLTNVYFTNTDYFVDADFTHRFSNYTCPVMNVYDSVTGNFYASFFGGISQYYYDEADATVYEDLNIPFTRDISTLIRYPDNSVSQVLHNQRFESLLGTNAIFVLNKDVPHYTNEVIQLHKVDGEIMAGYIFGGINADFPNFTPSTASNKLFKVMLTYDQPVSVNNTLTDNALLVYPNPATENIVVGNKTNNPVQLIAVYNAHGVCVQQLNVRLMQGDTMQYGLEELPAGIYFLHIVAGEISETRMIVIQ